ncbi:apolipoprotein N-acyltransferase [Alteriqipengyuania flavescens]|uniref:apolipoprotein N-acyltransferase n=1 Tax=Alteriqipengyuania flavescens TaxID=3053610 RepID=UPI0025B4236C|nr:apolipoprotein N-acyltransferase [Alteriqipengyuania flavescens]WJY19767.1 apolipoprotein N-acyltransferase [Alteriqipengyuania flavescens]WJY25709.1 apolipoprotein N-acyltransferase [Alteriqipengyuania flavescens]
MSRFDPVATRIARHPRIASALLGAVSATGFAPLSLWPLALLCLAIFCALVARTERPGAAAWLGWWFGFAHFTVGLNWIATAFTYQSNMPAALGWAAVPILSVYLAAYPAIGAFAARWLAGPRGGWAFALAMAGAWGVTEWLRGWVFTGFAWNPLGSILLGGYDTPGLAAVLPFTGTYALSALAMLLGALFWLLAAKGRWIPAGLIAGLVTIGMLVPAGEGAQGTTRVTIAQPDIRQPTLADPRFYETNYQKLATLSRRREGTDGLRLVLWPESGMVDYLQDGYPERYYLRKNWGGSAQLARARVAELIGPGSLLLTGSIDLALEDREAVGAYNVVHAIDDAGTIRGTYQKAHLVPYGEYLALRWLLEPLGATRLVPGTLDFFPGPGARTLDLGEFGKVGVQVCYEIVFSGETVEDGNRPDFIFNDSNDGWFGRWGPPQHLAQARLRAMEEGLPVLRATTTGISGIIDARGVLREHLPWQERGRIDALLPPAHAATPFAQAGNWLAVGWSLLLMLLAAVVRRRTGG